MTVVSLESSESGSRGIYSVKASGHATGSTEVCAAVSVLMTTLAGYVKNFASPIDIRLASADSAVIFTGGEDAKAAYNMAKIGFLQLENSYGSYIRVKN